uniref:BICD family-like cargo adapter 2 n=1 Tax=Xenopus tropicalis TaxID=8364 RepID=A0A6I8QAT4_XENTR
MGWNGGLTSPSMEEHFYPFLMERSPSYMGEDEEEHGDEDLSLVLERKDKDLLLAAELGKALLERNDQLMKAKDALEEELRETLEMIEQEKHNMRLKMEVQESEWRAQVADLESDLAEARLQMQQLLSEQRECGRESASAVQELSEQNQRLVEQLAQASQVEQAITLEMKSLKEENRDLTISRGQFAPCLQSLRSENALLLEKKKEMESQTKQLQEENDNVQNQLISAKEGVFQLQRQKEDAKSQVLQLELEAQKLRDSQRTLQLQLKELQDELHMRDSQFSMRGTHSSLHSEIQQSTVGQNHEVRIRPCLNSAETQSITSDYMDTYLTEREGDLLRENEEQTVRLQDQVTMQHIEITDLRKEVQRLKDLLQQNNADSTVKQAVLDRDEALMKKAELEQELARCQIEKESLNLQLLSTIQQKVMLSQELEAWQDDMQIVINQQLQSQKQQETQKPPESPQNSFLRRDSKRGKILSFFKNI